ncbi:hypothetical protein AA0113_g10910 [Alternaria arborescens]|uniref:SAP domain-containing protein n=1 Tax=Alternaria arborescens TaxID=156630 RepID=A0A4Q4QJU9_9PLEO|nr:hypothetical protein AA0113_g10910 [Alternaria arborescens]
MTPDDFDKLKKAAMSSCLKNLNLKSTGNMAVLRGRFKDWYNSQNNTASAGPSAGPSVDLSTEPATTTTVLDPGVPTTVSLYQRLFVKKKTTVSQVVLDAVHKLQYTPGKSFRRKGTNKDLSKLLGPIGPFTDTFLRVLDGMVLTPKASRNLVSVRINMVKQIPKIVTDAQLIPFFEAWGIRAIAASKSPSPRPDTEEERQIQMALQASRDSAAAEVARREKEDYDMLLDDDEFEDSNIIAAAKDETEKSRKAILQELDIVNSAIMHRFARWVKEFPKPKAEDMHWPNSFDQDERKQIKSFVRKYLDDHDMWLRDIDASEQVEAIDEMKDHADFPLAHARIAAVIQLCFIDLRRDRKRFSKTPDSTAASSRTSSPVKQSIEGRGEDDEGDQDGGNGRGSGDTASARGTTARGTSRGRPRGSNRGSTRGLPAGRGAGSGRGGAAAKRKASSMEDDDNDDNGDHDDVLEGISESKRTRTSTRTRSRLSTSYTAQDLEDAGDDDAMEDAGDDSDEEYEGEA